jgi:NAD(P)-dependent dehydrogenase (short-subunit alcohol dehydrogenase family)
MTTSSAPVHAAPLRGMRAVVTGGGGGIGFAIAQRLHALGASLVLVGRDVAKLDAALSRLEGDGNEALACDVGDANAVATLFASLDDADRSPHILVNNAGSAKAAPFAGITDELWQETLRVNLSGVFFCTRAALPGMLRLPMGRIVNVASTAGLVGYRNVAAYCAAKHGVVGLTRALALETARTGVTANAVCPGYTDTDIVRDAITNIARETGKPEHEARDSLLRRNPQHRLIAPEEVAATVGFLCLPESQSINGQAISLSGGEVMTG